MIQPLKAIGTYTVCDGTNNPDSPSTRPYAVLYKASTLVTERGSDSPSEESDFFEGLAYYVGNGKWLDHNNGFPTRSSMIDSESPDVPYIECAEPAKIDEKEDYSNKFRYTVYAYYPLPEYPEGIKAVLAGGEVETWKLVRQFRD